MSNTVGPSLSRCLGLLTVLVACAVVICLLYVWFAASNDSSFDDRLAECQLRLKAGDLASARSDLLRLHAQDETHPGVIQLLAELELRRGDSSQAIEWLQRFPTSAPEQAAVARYRAAQLAMQLGRAQATESLAQEALHLNPDFTEPRRLLLRYYFILLQQRKLHEQSVLLDQQGRLGPIDLVMRCVAHRAAWDDDEHLAWLEQCLRQEPANATIRAALAHYYSSRDRNEETWRVLAEASPDAPDYWRIQLARAEQESIEGHFEQALETLRGLPAEADGESRVWLARGKVWNELGYQAAATTAFENAAKLDPYDPTPSYALSRILAAQGASERADVLFARSQKQKALMALMSRLMEASNPAYHPVEPVEVTMRAAVDAFTSLQFGREAEILVWAQQAEAPANPLPAGRQMLSMVPLRDVVSLGDIPARPRPSEVSRAPSQRTRAAGAPVPPGTVRLRDIAERIELSFLYDTGRSPFRWIMETLGGGVAVLDYDLDGWDDLYLAQAGPLPVGATSAGDRLFRNLQGEKAEDVTTSAKLVDHAYGQGCAVGDYDNDGFADLVVCNYGECLVFRNQGDGTFQNTTQASGVSSSKWSTSAAFSDVDRDGDLDLYVVHYLDAEFESLKPCKLKGAFTSCRPFLYEGVQDTLWENLGNGQFVDRTAEFGLVAPQGKGLGVVIADFDRSGRESIFVGNDTTANFLFQWEPESRGGRFQETGIGSGVAVNSQGLTEACMGIATGDVDGDGRFDLFVTNFQGETNTLYRALGEGQFIDGTERAGLADSSRNRLGFGCQFLDLDCNGYLDLFVANGHLHEIPQLAQLYYNQGTGRFHEISHSAGPYFRQPRLGRSVALIDWNRDLLMDLAVTYQEGNTSLLENQSAAGNRLVLQFVGLASNRDAIGTLVQARIADRTSHFYVSRDGGYFAANDPKILIGCGDAEQVDHLQVTWPSGKVASFQDVRVARSYLVVEDRDGLLPRGD